MLTIAEIGQAHEGSLGIAHSYIDALAKELQLKVTSPSVFATIYSTRLPRSKKRPIVNTQGLRVSDRPFLRPTRKKESNN